MCASAIVSFMANQSMQLDHVFGALSDATRRAIVMRLCDGEASVGELAKPFEMALPSLMKHIRVLESSGLVASEKIGRVRTCSLQTEALQPSKFGWRLKGRSGSNDWIDWKCTLRN